MKPVTTAILIAVALNAAPALAQTEENPRLVDDGAAAKAVPVPQPRELGENPEVEVAFWTAVKDSDDPMLYLAYLERYPEGAFRVLARDRLEALWDRATRAFALLDELGVSLDAPNAPDLPPAAVVTPVPPPVTAAPPAIAVPKPSKPPAVPTTQLIRNAQNQLRKHLCYKGGVDGVWGDVSRAAMRRFNRRAGTDYPVRWPNQKALSYMRKLTRSGVQICR